MIPGRELTVDFALKALRRRAWLVAGPLFLGVLGGLIYSRSQPSLYRSDAVVQVVPQRIPDTYVEPTVTSRVEDRLSSLAQQVLSRTQMEAVILELDLYAEQRRTRPMEDVFELMTSRVLVAPLEATGRASRAAAGVDAFRISFEYSDPRIARDVVAKLASFFIDRNAAERGSQAEQTSDFLEAQLADARSRLEAQEKRLEAFRQRNAGRLPTQVQTNMQAIQNMQMSLQAMVESLARDRDRKQMLERLYTEAASDLAAGTAAPGAADLGPGSVSTSLTPGATARQRLEAAEKTLAQMEVRFSEKHPDVIRMKTIIADLEKQVTAEELSRPLSPDAAVAETPATPEEMRRRDRLREMRAEIESLDRQVAFKEGEERRMREQIGVYQARLEAVPAIESEWIALTRDYDTLNATYKELLAKSENSKMAASLEQRQIGEQFRILDPPRIPPTPASPNRIKINAVASLAGLGLGVLLIGFLEYRDTTMRSEADILKAIDIPLLALIPLVATDADRHRALRNRRLAAAGVAAVCLVTAVVFWHLQLWKYVM